MAVAPLGDHLVQRRKLPGVPISSRNRRAAALHICSSRTTSRSVKVGIPSQSATISWKSRSVSGRWEFRIATSYEGNSTISTKWDPSDRSFPRTLWVAVRFPSVCSAHWSMSRFISSKRLVLQSMICTKVMTPPGAAGTFPF